MWSVLLSGTDGYDQSLVAGDTLPHPRWSHVLETKRLTVKLGRLGHWELAVAVQCAALAVWLVRPGLGLGIAAAVLTLPALLLVFRRPLPLPGLVMVVGFIASVAAVGTSWRVRQVETEWEDLREDLIRSAGQKLEQAFLDAVTLASDLAGAALSAVGAQSQSETFELLRRAVDEEGPEHGAVLLDSAGRAVAWAGNHRLRPDPTGREISARITPFYVLLEAERQQGGHVGLGHVVLAADSAVPDRDQTLAAQFARETGAGLEFYQPERAPVDEDVFDFYLEGLIPPDTLFSVLTIPPSQGTLKLDLVSSGTRRVSLLLVITLVLLMVSARTPARWTGAVGIGAILIFTPAGTGLGLRELFSGATYYLDAWGPISASAGSLLVMSSLLVMAIVQFSRKVIPWRRPCILVAAGLVVLAPYAMEYLASGITPPTGVGMGGWLSWQSVLSVSSAVLLFLGAGLLLGKGAWSAPAWTAWLAALWAAANAILGLFLWSPVEGCPSWFPLVWLPPIALAVLPAPKFRRVVAVSVVTGAAAALLTWCVVVEGRLVLAERDVTRAGGGDPFARGLLDEFGSQLLEGRVPRTSASLYAAWRNSALGMDDFPAALTTWAPDGRMLARLDLAKLDLSPELLRVQAASARDSGVSLEERVVLPPTIFVRNVPFPDGSVVSVAVGPISRLIEPVRLGRFLRGERRLVVPYEMSLGRPITESEAEVSTVWERSGWTVRGLGSVQPDEDFYYQVHVHVSLGSLGGTLLRGALVCFWSVFLVGALWLIGEAIVGGLVFGPVSRWSLGFRSYRVRLVIALASFFILPTIAFAVWSIVRLRVTAASSGDLIIEETLSDAANTARFYAAVTPDTLQARLARLAEQLNADLLWYRDGVLQHASPSALVELGMVDRFLPPEVYRQLVIDAEPRVTVDEVVGGQATRVGFHGLSALGAVLAAPRLVDVRDIQSGREDLLFGLLLTALLGLAAAAKLAAVAAQSLAKPVRSLRSAALAVGRGDPLPGFEPGVPSEFVPVFEAFERMAHDIEASQSALEAARRRTAAVLRNVATAVVALDRNLRVTIANPRAEHLLGTELLSESPIDRVAGPEWKPVWDWLREFLQQRHESDSEEFTVAARQIRAQVAAIGGTPGGCVLALDDTTELTRAIRILAWGELARQIAHEIKNPLTPIRLGIQHLSRAHRDGRDDFGETLDRTARQILAEIERLDAIARAFSRFGAPPAEAEQLTDADVTAIAVDTVELYRLGDGTAVSLDAGGAIIAQVRKDEVKEVLVNLIENARDAGAVEVRVTVAREPAGDVVIRVVDDGRGIPTKDIPLVFEPQFSTTTSGTGLGLAICKRLVESWGGSISVESGSHAGTAVTIRIPQEGRPA